MLGILMPYEVLRFPHDGTVDADGQFVAPLSAQTRAKVLGENVRRIYGLD